MLVFNCPRFNQLKVSDWHWTRVFPNLQIKATMQVRGATQMMWWRNLAIQAKALVYAVKIFWYCLVEVRSWHPVIAYGAELLGDSADICQHPDTELAF